MISTAQLRELEADIRSELARIERSIERDAENYAVPDYDSGMRAGSVTGGDGELTVTLAGRAQARRMELVEALRRIEDGRYGVCGHCGEGIPYGRLLVVPEATNCLECRS
jgi:DnaK suppressor protein